MMKTKTTIKQSAYDTSWQLRAWKDCEGLQAWPGGYVLRGGKYSSGEYFVFASSTDSPHMEDIMGAKVYYGTGITMHVAEEEAYKRFLQDEQV